MVFDLTQTTQTTLTFYQSGEWRVKRDCWWENGGVRGEKEGGKGEKMNFLLFFLGVTIVSSKKRRTFATANEG